MPELLFIYGTLHPDRAPAEIAPIARTLTPLGPATVQGTLLDLGAYSGVLLSPHGREVPGNLFTLPQPPAATWEALDRYEDFRPLDPDSSLFIRRKTTATRADGQQVLCWIYTYNRP